MKKIEVNLFTTTGNEYTIITDKVDETDDYVSFNLSDDTIDIFNKNIIEHMTMTFFDAPDVKHGRFVNMCRKGI